MFLYLPWSCRNANLYVPQIDDPQQAPEGHGERGRVQQVAVHDDTHVGGERARHLEARRRVRL